MITWRIVTLTGGKQRTNKMSNKKQQKEIDKAIRNLMKYADQQSVWQERLSETFSQVLGQTEHNLGLKQDELASKLHDAGLWHMVMGYLFEAFATTHWDGEKQSCIDDYLKRRGWRESPAGRRYLQAMSQSEVALWEVTSIKPGHSATLRPYGSDAKPIRVYEKAATESLQQWDCVAARVIQTGNRRGFTGGILPLPPAEARQAINLLEAARERSIDLLTQLVADGEEELSTEEILAESTMEAENQFTEILFEAWASYVLHTLNRSIPQLQNRDGEDLQLTKVRFPVNTSSEILTPLLDQLPELQRNGTDLLWSWFPVAVEEIQDGESVNLLGTLSLNEKALELDTNSTERADRGERWLSDVFGDHLGLPLRIHENLEQLLNESPSSDPAGVAAPSDEERELMKSFMDQHYQKTLDEPIPALNNRTPRECSADPALHKEVVEWIKSLENTDAHSPSPDYDFSWIWEELGLESHRH